MTTPVKQRWISCLAAALLTASLSSALSHPAMADAMADLDAAINAFRGGDNETALALLDAAIDSGELEGETLAGAHNNRGIILNSMERHGEAIGAFSLALAVVPDLPQAFRGRAVALNKLGRFAEAISDFDMGLADRPRDPFTLNERGLAYVGLGQHARAAEDFEAALEFEPGFMDARGNLVAALMAAGQTDRLASIEAGELVVLGRTQLNQSEYELALETLTRALGLDPHHADALFDRGRVFMRLGRYEDAVANYSTLLADDPANGPAYYNRGLSYENLDRYGDAVADYTADIALRPDNLDSYSRRGRAHAELLEFAAAVADYTVILDQEIFNTSALRSRGYAAFHLGRFELTRQDHDLAVRDELASHGTRIFSAIWSYLGATHLDVDGTADLLENMEEISVTANRFAPEPVNLLVDVWPGPVAALYLGVIGPSELRAYGIETENQTQAERLTEVTFYLGQYYLGRGDLAQARALFEETLATGVTNYFEYDGARSELARMDGR